MNRKCAFICSGICVILLLIISVAFYAIVMSVGWALRSEHHGNSLISGGAVMSTISVILFVPTYIFYIGAFAGYCPTVAKSKTAVNFLLIFNMFGGLLGIIGGILFISAGATWNNQPNIPYLFPGASDAKILNYGLSAGVFGILAGCTFLCSRISCWICFMLMKKDEDINHKAACRCNGVSAAVLLGISCFCHASVMAIGWILANQLYREQSSLAYAAAVTSTISAILVPAYACNPCCCSGNLFKLGLICNVFSPLLAIIGGVLFLAVGVTLDNNASNVLPLRVSVGVFGILAGSTFVSSQISYWVCCVHKYKLYKDEEKGDKEKELHH